MIMDETEIRKKVFPEEESTPKYDVDLRHFSLGRYFDKEIKRLVSYDC